MLETYLSRWRLLKTGVRLHPPRLTVINHPLWRIERVELTLTVLVMTDVPGLLKWSHRLSIVATEVDSGQDT
jgi:hypothetical protein